MNDEACIRFLQWALPQLHMRWPGFRKVRRQVCKRISRRLRELRLPHINAYQALLREQATEWPVLDSLCRVTISRFYRDRGVFDCLGRRVLPALAKPVPDDGVIQCWCAGAASGEEPYTLAMLWHFTLARLHPGVSLRIIGSDIDPAMGCRARQACYLGSSLKELPDPWISQGFVLKDDRYCLRPLIRDTVSFVTQDIREAMPDGPFHLILCRNLVFTYFDHRLQQAVLKRLCAKLHDTGALVIGMHESLPGALPGLAPWLPRLPIYRKVHAQTDG